MVVEEKYVGQQDIPALQAIGWEGEKQYTSYRLHIHACTELVVNHLYSIIHSFITGIFGFIGISLAMIPLNYITAPPPFADNSRGTLEATVEAFIQIGTSSKLLVAIIGWFVFL